MIVSLEVKSGPLAGKGIRLQSGQSIRVGRTRRSDFVISGDSHLSGLHFAIESEGNDCRLKDLNSRNGTLLNGQAVSTAPVQSGDTIVAGETTFAVMIQMDEAAVDVAPVLSPDASPQQRLLALLR